MSKRADVQGVQGSAAHVTKSKPRGQARLYVIARNLAGEFEGRRTREVRVPMLPAAAMNAMVIANDAEATSREMEDAIGEDPLLSARVLQVASSPVYSPGSPVRSLHGAVMRLGQQTLREVLYQAVAEAHVFRGGSRKVLAAQRAHCVAVAHLTKSVTLMLGADGEYAFLCGLLHDLGRSVLLQVLSEDPQDLTHDEMEKVIGLAHVPVGAAVARVWQLPALVVEAIERHHDFEDGRASLYSRIGHAVAAAEAAANHHGIGRDVTEADFDDHRFTGLGLSRDQVIALFHQAAVLRSV